MNILHSSDWHLGRSLFGRRRHDEFAAFLDWLTDVIHARRPDVLLVSGDVFDTGTPGVRAQELYYRFLRRAADSPCRHVVITAGNHDSPSFLDAPRALLDALRVHVVGAALPPPSPEDPDGPSLRHEVITLRDAAGRAELIVCAVPFLRDADLRVSAPGESQTDREARLREGLLAHYAAVTEEARVRRAALEREEGVRVPLVLMGHLFAVGGKTVDGDGVRDLYVGSLAAMPASAFAPDASYVALGHLHVPQAVGGLEHIRYSGSPLPMGFGEAAQQKSVCLAELDADGPARVELLPVPRFRRLESLRGRREAILARLDDLIREQAEAWLEIIPDNPSSALRDELEARVINTRLDILRIRDRAASDAALCAGETEDALEELEPREVFERLLDARHTEEEKRPALRQTYAELLHDLENADTGPETE